MSFSKNVARFFCAVERWCCVMMNLPSCNHAAAARVRVLEKPESTARCIPRAPQRAASTKGEPDTGPTVCRGHGNCSSEIPRHWQLGQLKKHTGFLVSRSLTLTSAPPWVEGVIWWFSLYLKKNCFCADDTINLYPSVCGNRSVSSVRSQWAVTCWRHVTVVGC